MLSDAQLDAIVHNLDQLGLAPAVRFRVIAALAPVLLGPEKLTTAGSTALPKPSRVRRTGSRTRRARGPRRRKAPISLAREIAGKARRKRRPNGKSEPEPRPLSSDVSYRRPRDPDALALSFLKSELARGPIAAAAVDDMVEGGRLSAASVERAKEQLGVVAIRINNGKGAVVHLRLPPQRAEAEA